MAKLDRRVVRTRQLLRDALLALILEKGYEAVTVGDITDRANLGLATFYLHYRDKDELLFTTLETIFDELVERMDTTAAGLDNSPPLLAFQHAGENSVLYKIILTEQRSGVILNRVREYVGDVIQKQVIWKFSAESTIPRDMLVDHMASSLLNLIRWWLEAETPYSAEEMTIYFYRIMLGGIVNDLTPEFQQTVRGLRP